MDLLIEENFCLKTEIAYLKDLQSQVPRKLDLQLTYLAVEKKSNNVLIVKQKETQRRIKEVKEYIRKNVDPTDMGVGVMGRVTKQGGVIINCSSSKEIGSVQTEIPNNLEQVTMWRRVNLCSTVSGLSECKYERKIYIL